jgi:hypothetical protein
MSLKGWGSLPFIIAIVVLSSSGSSLSPVDRERTLPNTGGATSRTEAAMISKGSVVFSNALRPTPKDGAVILLNANPNGAGSGDLSGMEDSLTSLPEPGSVILVGLGFLAIICLLGDVAPFSRAAVDIELSLNYLSRRLRFVA